MPPSNVSNPPPDSPVAFNSFARREIRAVLFANEQQSMLLVAARLVDLPERAEEIVQDAFEKTLVAWPRLREPGAYLRAAVVNGCRSELRRRQVLRRHPAPPPAVVELGERNGALLGGSGSDSTE